ncbi:family 10 glycosylhydrolase [Cyanobium sp. NS01]|uniref:family 10 glycosylhydrolase n=1 Tax=Cyanobium sp. NS01 TaxID=261284 RepID=UPI001CECD0E9|nr:glycoside hydrolase family 10 protein [Cyanobium sp. NS01]
MRRPVRFLAVLLALLTWGLTLLGHGSALAVRAQNTGTGTELRGVWLTANDMPVLRDRQRMTEAVSQLATLQFNTLYPVVWNGAIAYYPSQVVQERQLQTFTYLGLQGQDVLGELIAEGKRQGLLVIPWFEFGFMAPKDSVLARRHPDWLTRKQDGGMTSISAAGEVAWLNPFRPEVQQLITDLVVEVVGRYGADGIQFDDHMSLPKDFGYDPFTLALYRKETGRAAPANPADGAWVKWRADKITAFMERLTKEVRRVRPGAVISVSPNYYAFAYKLQLQDWLAWVRRGLVDELLVQIYRPDLEDYLPHLGRAEVIEARAKIPTAIAIMSGQRNRPAPLPLLGEKVRANRSQGLGVAFFYFESLWNLGPESPEQRKAELGRWFAAPAPRRTAAAPSPQPAPPPPRRLPAPPPPLPSLPSASG